ncbi:MAG: DUF3422 domain-containing protein [Rhodanobacter sp.]
MTRQVDAPAQPLWNRQRLNDELFRRAPVPVGTHVLVTHTAMLQDAALMREAADYLRIALRTYGDYQESGDHDYQILRVRDTAQVKYERHTEFTDYTQVGTAGGHASFAQDAGTVPTDWMDALPGLRIASCKLHILPKDDDESVSRAIGALSAPTPSSTVADGQARIWADCRMQEDGYTRILVVDSGMPPDRRARLVQRLLEIEDYRMLAMLGFEPARSIMKSLQGMESQLQNLMTQVADSQTDSGQDQGEKILHQLLSLAAQVQQHSTDHTFRFDASRAYFELVNKRIRELREERIQGSQRLGYFLDRRLGPAMQTMEAVRGRLETLSDHIDRAASLIRTRVDLGLQRKSSHLLRSMNRRSAQQLRLQQTVEGLSLLAISYYSLGIVMYLAKAAVDFGIALKPTMVAGVAAPVIIGGVYWVIHRIGKRVIKHSEI